MEESTYGVMTVDRILKRDQTQQKEITLRHSFDWRDVKNLQEEMQGRTTIIFRDNTMVLTPISFDVLNDLWMDEKKKIALNIGYHNFI